VTPEPAAHEPVTIDARGVLCPVPIIRLARAAAELPRDSVVELLTDDPAAQYDVPAWCRLRGHALVRTEPATDLGPGVQGTGPTGAEPSVPNADPDPALRHVIRIGAAGTTAE
jgi:tRNA 2-thiouridine synthesizing protein A